MPHSMQGTRGQVRFRGKTSPRFNRVAAQQQRDEQVRELILETRAMRKEMERERSKTLVSRVKERVKGFASRLLSRGVR